MSEEELFDVLAAAPASERERLLTIYCSNDPRLRDRLLALLAAHDADAVHIDKPLQISSTEDHLSSSDDHADQLIGRYRLLQKLGEGGMGTVWVAEQISPVKRRVALKLIKAGMDSARIVARFEAERQALAMMDHPHIAKVLDAGATPDGRPFFAMELVKGVPITKYCDEVQATLTERLELFVQVCGAAQHAHQKGIIHRDLKPTNILVAMHDGVAAPKVIDFGVAKALHSKLAERTLYTEIGQVIGTLEYMAPEQAELSAMDIDTRADVYALGVLLYELLSGSTPITRERLKKAGFAEILRIIKEEEPPRPSTRLSASNESLPSLAVQRRMEPKRLAAALANELDWIALKALEKNRARRYETANALAADVRKYLADEPVEARPPSRAYRFQKFCRRNRGLVVGTALVFLALVGGILGTSWGFAQAKLEERKARSAESEAKEKRDEAIKERKKADEAWLAEAKQRRSAEMHLVEGILRPIGFNSGTLTEAERRSYAEWAALDSPLRLLVLERALADPKRLEQLSKDPGRVTACSVGLSPNRRRKAVSMLEEKASDPRTDAVTLRACFHLGLELGVERFPRLDECLMQLIEENNRQYSLVDASQALAGLPMNLLSSSSDDLWQFTVKASKLELTAAELDELLRLAKLTGRKDAVPATAERFALSELQRLQAKSDIRRSVDRLITLHPHLTSELRRSLQRATIRNLRDRWNEERVTCFRDEIAELNSSSR